MSDLHSWERTPGGWHVSSAGEIHGDRGLGWYLRPPYSERRIGGTDVYLEIGPFATLAKAKQAAEELAGVPEMQEVLAA